MSNELNGVSLESLAGALAYVMGIEPPVHAAAPNEALVDYIDKTLPGKKADRMFLYNTDAIGQWVFEKYSYFTEMITCRTQLQLPMVTADPPKTPVCFGTMYTGAAPKVHGIEVYEKKRIEIDTLFDALARAGKKVALLTRANYSMAVIFNGRPIDYYFYSNWPDVNAKAVELIIKDEYDVILTYNGNYDDKLHVFGPEAPETLAELHYNCMTYSMFDRLIQTHWKNHDVLIGTGMDHGCHACHYYKTTGELRLGTHGDNTPEDRNIIHCYQIYPKGNE